jgi:hypothetical protein
VIGTREHAGTPTSWMTAHTTVPRTRFNGLPHVWTTSCGATLSDAAGPTFSSDTAVLFADLQGPGHVVAITGAFEIETHQDIVRRTVTHARLRTPDERRAIGQGWPAVLANLKTLLETGDVLPQEPWAFHAEERDAPMAERG